MSSDNEPEEKEKEEQEGEKVEPEKGYTDDSIEPEEETEEKEKNETISKTTVDAFAEILGSNLPEYQKEQFKDSFVQLGTPMAELAGVEDSYPQTIEKMKEFLPGPIRVVLGITGLTLSGLFVKKQLTGRTMKNEIRSTLGIVNKRKQKQGETGQNQADKDWKDLDES